MSIEGIMYCVVNYPISKESNTWLTECRWEYSLSYSGVPGVEHLLATFK